MNPLVVGRDDHRRDRARGRGAPVDVFDHRTAADVGERLAGSRDDWYLAGMMAIAEARACVAEGPDLETGGTANLTTAITCGRAGRAARLLNLDAR